MWICLDKLRTYYKKEVISHFYSDFRMSDINNRDRVMKKKQLEHFYYILNNSVVSLDVLDKVKEYEDRDFLSEINCYTYWNNEYKVKDVMVRLVEEIGLDNILKLTKEFNDKYIEELKIRKGRKK